MATYFWTSVPLDKQWPWFQYHTTIFFSRDFSEESMYRLRKLDINWSLCPLFFINFFYQMIALEKLWKMFFISSKKLILFSRYSNFCVFVFPCFFPVSHCFRSWLKKNLKVYDVINCLNKNLITHFVWYLEKEISCDIETLSIDRILNTEHFYWKIKQKMCTKS